MAALTWLVVCPPLGLPATSSQFLIYFWNVAGNGTNLTNIYLQVLFGEIKVILLICDCLLEGINKVVR